VAAGLTAFAFLPESFYAEHLQMVDHDDSVHLLEAAELAAIPRILACGAILAAALAGLLAVYRRRCAAELGRLRTETAALLSQLRLPATLPFASILVAGLLVRLATLDGPMRFDEADTFDYFASRDLFNLLTDYTAPNNHMLHTICVRLSYLAFGDSPPALRLPALLAGLLVLPLTFLLARRLFDEPAAFLAMALAAGQPALIFYAANARGYSAVAVCTLVVFLAASFLRRERNGAAWLAFAAAGALGMFTIPVMIYPLATASLWLLWSACRARRAPATREIAGSAVVIATASALFYTPAALRAGVSAIVANPYVAPISWQAMVDKLPVLIANSWFLWTVHLSAPVLLGLAAACVLGLRERESQRLAISAVATAAACMAAQRVVPYARVFVYLAPLFCLVAAAGLRRVSSEWRLNPANFAPALAVALAAHYTVGYVWFPSSAERRYRELASLTRTLLDHSDAQTGVLGAIPLSEPIRYGFFTNGRPRGQVLAPNVGSGGLPRLHHWESVLVVRRREDTLGDSNRIPGSVIDFEDPVFVEFSKPELLVRGEQLEVFRLSRLQAPDNP
jgi:hypothetical protein